MWEVYGLMVLAQLVLTHKLQTDTHLQDILATMKLHQARQTQTMQLQQINILGVLEQAKVKVMVLHITICHLTWQSMFGEENLKKRKGAIYDNLL